VYRRGHDQKKPKVNAVPPSDDDKGMCSDVLLKVHEAAKTIREYKVCDKIEEAKPFTIAQGGQQGVFDAAQCTKAPSQENNKYKCSGKFFWQVLPWLASHRGATKVLSTYRNMMREEPSRQLLLVQVVQTLVP